MKKPQLVDKDPMYFIVGLQCYDPRYAIYENKFIPKHHWVEGASPLGPGVVVGDLYAFVHNVCSNGIDDSLLTATDMLIEFARNRIKEAIEIEAQALEVFQNMDRGPVLRVLDEYPFPITL